MSKLQPGIKRFCFEARIRADERKLFFSSNAKARARSTMNKSPHNAQSVGANAYSNATSQRPSTHNFFLLAEKRQKSHLCIFCQKTAWIKLKLCQTLAKGPRAVASFNQIRMWHIMMMTHAILHMDGVTNFRKLLRVSAAQPLAHCGKRCYFMISVESRWNRDVL